MHTRLLRLQVYSIQKQAAEWVLEIICFGATPSPPSLSSPSEAEVWYQMESLASWLLVFGGSFSLLISFGFSHIKQWSKPIKLVKEFNVKKSEESKPVLLILARTFPAVSLLLKIVSVQHTAGITYKTILILSQLHQQKVYKGLFQPCKITCHYFSNLSLSV